MSYLAVISATAEAIFELIFRATRSEWDGRPGEGSFASKSTYRPPS